jgi:hypothetical protein
MVAIFLKAVFLYFIISFFRSLWRGYKMVEKIKKKGNENFQEYQNADQKSSRPKKSGDVIEAEFRVINKK